MFVARWVYKTVLGIGGRPRRRRRWSAHSEFVEPRNARRSSCMHFSRAGALDTILYIIRVLCAYYIHCTLCMYTAHVYILYIRVYANAGYTCTRVAVAANDARPGTEPVRGSAALPASSLKAPCAGPFVEGAYTHALYIMISTRVYVTRRCVRVLPTPLLLLPRSSRREATEGRAIPEWLLAAGRGGARRERGHDLLGVAPDAHAPPVNKQRGGFSFSLFTSSSRRAALLYTNTQYNLIIRAACYDIIISFIIL